MQMWDLLPNLASCFHFGFHMDVRKLSNNSSALHLEVGLHCLRNPRATTALVGQRLNCMPKLKDQVSGGTKILSTTCTNHIP